MSQPRFIFVTGGVVSSLGKGIAAASLGACLRASGASVLLRKIDPYLNVDSGTMSPAQHGEVFVTQDGAETDLDLGHYERFVGQDACAADSITAGHVYQNVIQRERQGGYLGETVQIIPHVTDEIRNLITHNTQGVDFVICEVGGTVGDIEGLPFLEAIRQLRNVLGGDRTLVIHVALVPYILAAHESKTKPAQHSVKELQRAGIQPDILLCRCDRPLELAMREKLAQFCNIPFPRVIEALDVQSIYQAPVAYHQAGLDAQVWDHFKLQYQAPDLSRWHNIVQRVLHPKQHVKIAIIGKYLDQADSYKSLTEALVHAATAHHAGVVIEWIDAVDLEKKEIQDSDLELLHGVHGVIVPGGFGVRGVEGKIQAIRLVREKKIPFLGICLGMQLAIIESARHLGGMPQAISSEFLDEVAAHGEDPQVSPLVGLLSQWMKADELKEYTQSQGLGGTMRLGEYPCQLADGTLAHTVYGETLIHERHRHRYEVNMHYKECLQEAGVVLSGFCPSGDLPEIMERPDHPWFVGVQFHPELRSRPFQPHPLFISFLEATLELSRS